MAATNWIRAKIAAVSAALRSWIAKPENSVSKNFLILNPSSSTVNLIVSGGGIGSPRTVLPGHSTVIVDTNDSAVYIDLASGGTISASVYLGDESDNNCIITGPDIDPPIVLVHHRVLTGVGTFTVTPISGVDPDRGGGHGEEE